MTEEKIQENKKSDTQDNNKAAGTAVVSDSKKSFSPKKVPFLKRRGRGKFERQKPEFEQKIINIRRVTRVVAGGRRFSFSVVMILGDKKGSVGLGTGKAGDTALAIEKAIKRAKKNLRKINTTESMSIPHDVQAKFCSSVVMIMPNKGRGIVAGSSVRDILNLGGLKNVSAKILSGSKNKLNNAQAAIKALDILNQTTIRIQKSKTDKVKAVDEESSTKKSEDKKK